MRRLTAAVLVALSALLTACGTTVPLGGGQPAPGSDLAPSDATSGGTAPGGSSSTGGPVGGPGGSTGSGLEVTTGHSGTTGASGSAGSGGGSGSRPRVAPIAGGTVALGFVLPAGSPGNLVGSSFGYDADTSTKVAQAYVDELNATGGVAGRKVRPVFAYVDSSDQSDGTQTTLQNQACVALTEDAHVFAAVALQPTALNFAYDCFARHRTPLVDANLNGTDEQRMEQLYPWLMTPVYMSFSRMARLLPQSLKAQGFLTKKMALIAYDRPDLRRSAEQVLIPGIEALGGKVVDKYYLEGSYQGLSTGTASAALKYAGEGVDRVVMWAPGGGALVLFARQAESQGYRPRYGITTYDAPALTASLLGNVAPAQLKGATGTGFLRGSDMADAQSGPLTSREKHCLEVVRKRAGLSYSTRRQSGAGLAFGTCELTRFLQAALLSRVGAALAPEDVAVQVAALGRTYRSAIVDRTSFSRRKLDGAAVAHDLYFDSACSCFRYRAGARAVPE